MVFFIKNNLYYSFIFYILFLINNNYIISYNIDLSIIDPKDLETIYTICKKENFIFCSMIEAIKYSFSLIKTEAKSYPSNCSELSCLKYENVYTPNIICEDVEAKIDKKDDPSDEGYIISFSNCTAIIEGSISIQNETQGHSKKFLSQMYFDNIIFFQNSSLTKGELNIRFNYDETFNNSFNYDKTDPIFTIDDTNLIMQMNNILIEILENYIYSIKSKIEIDENTQLAQIKYLNEISNKFAKGFSLFGFWIQDDENNISYIAYNHLEYRLFINIKNKLFIPSLSVDFEYAVNYNITYNEGNLIFENVSISRNSYDDYFGDITNKTAEYIDIIPEKDSNLIWNTIKEDFSYNFRKYK